MAPCPPLCVFPLALALAAACTPRPSPDDSDDTSQLDTDDSAPDDTGEPDTLSPWLDGADWYRARSVAPDAGLVWELDESFAMPGYTVPSILVLHGGAGYRMFLTDMADRGSIYMARSANGLDWAVDPSPIATPDDWEGACGRELRDVTQVYLDDGSYRLLVEGYSDGKIHSTICSVWSADGDAWEIEEGVRFTGSEEDEGITSVLDVLWYRPARAWLLYYVAAWDAPDGNAIRAGISYDGETFQPLSGGNVFLQHRVDPDVVRVDGGPGLRMYHTIWREGHPGWAEGSDPLTFEDMGALPNLQDNSYHPGQDPEPGDLALFDPSYLRLPDGTMVMYLGAWYTGHDGWTLSYVWRAVAMDGAAPAPRP